MTWPLFIKRMVGRRLLPMMPMFSCQVATYGLFHCGIVKVEHRLDAAHLSRFNYLITTAQIPGQRDLSASGEFEDGRIAMTHLRAIQESTNGIVLVLVSACLVKDEIATTELLK